MTTENQRIKVSSSTTIALWTRAGGLCSICSADLFIGPATSPSLLGEAAHIIAASARGPRGTSVLTAEQRAQYENLILLCPNHHTEVDRTPAAFPPDRLRQIKRDHEASIARRLARGAITPIKLGTYDYINIPRIAMDPVIRADPTVVSQLLDVAASTPSLHALAWNLIRVLVAVEQIVEAWQPRAIKLEDVDLDQPLPLRIWYEGRVWTKNGPAPSDEPPKLTGDISKDPYVYAKIGKRKALFLLDPRWITTSTAFHTFRSGHVRLAILGAPRAMNDSSLLISPIVVGQPYTEAMALFDTLSTPHNGR